MTWLSQIRIHHGKVNPRNQYRTNLLLGCRSPWERQQTCLLSAGAPCCLFPAFPVQVRLGGRLAARPLYFNFGSGAAASQGVTNPAATGSYSFILLPTPSPIPTLHTHNLQSGSNAGTHFQLWVTAPLWPSRALAGVNNEAGNLCLQAPVLFLETMGLAAALVRGHKKYLRLWALESEWIAHSVLLCHTEAEISPKAESLWWRNEGSFITLSHDHGREEPEQLPTIILTPGGNNLWFFHHCLGWLRPSLHQFNHVALTPRAGLERRRARQTKASRCLYPHGLRAALWLSTASRWVTSYDAVGIWASQGKTSVFTAMFQCLHGAWHTVGAQ